MATDSLEPKYTIFDNGYERNLVKTDSFYDKDIANVDKVSGSVASSLIGSGELIGNINVKDGFLQSDNYVAGITGWKLTPEVAYLPSLDLSGYLLATGGAYKTAASGSRVEIFPDANTGIIAYAADGVPAFTVLVGGTDAGDVIMGGASAYAKWDKSAGTFTVIGAIQTGEGSVINGEYIDALSVGKLTAGTITSKAITLSFTEGAGDCYIAAGKTDFDHDESGFIMGIDDSDSNKVKLIIGTPTEYLMVDGSTFVNTLRVGGYTAGNTVLVASDAEKSDATVSTPTVMKQIKMGRDGTYRVSWQMRAVNTQADTRRCYWQLNRGGYWNGDVIKDVSASISGYGDTGWFDTAYVDATAVYNQSFYLYGHADAGVTCYVRNFKIKVSALNEITAPSVIVA